MRVKSPYGKGARVPGIRIWIAALMSLPAVALAQMLDGTVDADVAPQRVSTALIALSKQAGIQVVMPGNALDKFRTPGLHARMPLRAALSALLEGTGFQFHEAGERTIHIDPAAPSAAPRAGEGRSDTRGDTGKTLETVEVTAKAEGLAAMRVPTELREIPQSVSVITQDTLQQQNAFDIAGAFNWATGITTQQFGTDSTVFYSRGFPVREFHVDGSAPMGFRTGANGGNAFDDLSEYDRIEVLRGADGLFGGVGDPSATVNLVRKQPQATAQVSLAATLGSWDFYRLQLDATGPLGFDGALRGRVVASAIDQDFFYDFTHRRQGKLYGTLAYDLGPSTVLTVGGSVDQSHTANGGNALPLYADGADPHLPRSSGIGNLGSDHAHSEEGFLQLDQRFGENWKLKLSLTRSNQRVDGADASYGGAIDPQTGLILSRGAPMGWSTIKQPYSSNLTWDATLTGGFDWRGRRQDLVVGLDYVRDSFSESLFLGQKMSGPPLNPWHFDPTAYTVLPPSPAHPVFTLSQASAATGIGGYAALRLRPWEGGSIILGGRDNYERENASLSYALDKGAGPVTLLSLSVPNTTVAGGVATPYGGVVQDLNAHYSLYASYADIYQPNFGEKTFTGELIPAVQGVNVEAGLKAVWADGLLNGSLALFRIHQDNLAITDPNHPRAPGGCCYLSATNRSKGVEAELTGRLTPDWQWSAGYTFNVNRQYANIPVSVTGGITPLTTFAPKHLLKLWTQYRLPGAGQRWSLGGGLKAQTHTYETGSACALVDPDPQSRTGCLVPYRSVRIVQGFYAVATLRAVYRIAPHWSAALNIDNLTDRRYYQTLGTLTGGNWYGTPRSLMLTLDGTL